MVQLIKHIDAIAREKHRDVFFMTFVTKPKTDSNEHVFGVTYDYLTEVIAYRDYHDNPNRKKVLDWLEKNEIYYEECARMACETGWCAYQGEIFIDVICNNSDPNFRKVIDFVEDYEDHGWSLKYPGIRNWIMSLELAMKNAHHDEPGFWEKWAEGF